MSSTRSSGSFVPHISRTECIDSCGTPISQVSIPSRVAAIGPIVEPHAMLLREENVCNEIFASAAADTTGSKDDADVA